MDRCWMVCCALALLNACSADSSAGPVRAGEAAAVSAGAAAPLLPRGGAAGAVQAGSIAGRPALVAVSGGSAASARPAAAAANAGMSAPPSAAGSPAAVSGGAPATTAASAGSGALAMRSLGCGKAATMTGQYQAMIRAFDLDRGYYMSVPKDYNPERAHRLVFGFHGSGYTGKMMRQYLDNEKAPLLDGTIFVYPDGLPVGDDPQNTAWELKANGRDLAFFDALLGYLRENFCIDETRILVNGQSFGALMTNFVGCARADVIRAIAAVAGSGPRGMCTGKVAVWLTHGTDDMSVAFKSGEASRDFWVAANGCSTMTAPGMPAQCQVYQGCDPEHPVIWCPHTGDGGHQHPSFGRAAAREFLASF